MMEMEREVKHVSLTLPKLKTLFTMLKFSLSKRENLPHILCQVTFPKPALEFKCLNSIQPEMMQGCRNPHCSASLSERTVTQLLQRGGPAPQPSSG
jgi:hypothetical protein